MESESKRICGRAPKRIDCHSKLYQKATDKLFDRPTDWLSRQPSGDRWCEWTLTLDALCKVPKSWESWLKTQRTWTANISIGFRAIPIQIRSHTHPTHTQHSQTQTQKQTICIWAQKGKRSKTKQGKHLCLTQGHWEKEVKEKGYLRTKVYILYKYFSEKGKQF